jgi:hypothetical protein
MLSNARPVLTFWPQAFAWVPMFVATLFVDRVWGGDLISGALEVQISNPGSVCSRTAGDIVVVSLNYISDCIFGLCFQMRESTNLRDFGQ